jgi:hypothetical protein
MKTKATTACYRVHLANRLQYLLLEGILNGLFQGKRMCGPGGIPLLLDADRKQNCTRQ